MLRKVCKGKLHRLHVTQADLNYMGSITLDAALMHATDIRPHEMVQITNLENGVLWQTYAIPGAEGSGVVCLNGPPARHFQPGDTIIVLSLGWMDEAEWESLRPNVVFVNEMNQITNVVTENPYEVWNELRDNTGRS
ncbi:aspartate 1-decarboxylase [Alicyclobacillus dauci]|uniref:Aspartate 1-decarboxylase n=1 Tax=Alicyclobacillus dauci TaxID=1475485 RepID=A0ABY6Z783_9BACL|nr:aspartate 1-decarboxylase [Alicyclobacillus dauci]WAH38687.1 aspartate 1-decarboxylase [Alicyclobacillus dauci]